MKWLKSNWAKVALVIAIFLFGMAQANSCRNNAELKALKAEYKEFKNVTKANDEIRAGIEATQVAAIADRDKQIAALMDTISTDRGMIDSLNTTIEHLKATEPPTTPEIEAMPIVINLRAQVKTLTNGFNLAQTTIANQEKVIVEWQGKFDAMKAIADARLGAIQDRDKQIKSLEGIVKKQDSGWGIFHLFGLRVNLVRDIVVPIGAFSLGYIAGK